MIHADKDWIRLRAELTLDVVEDAAQAHTVETFPSTTIAEAVDLLYNSPTYMGKYANSMDRKLHGEPIPNEPIQR